MQTRDRKEIQSDTQSDNRACEISTLALADKLLGSAPEYTSFHPTSRLEWMEYTFFFRIFCNPGQNVSNDEITHV